MNEQKAIVKIKGNGGIKKANVFYNNNVKWEQNKYLSDRYVKLASNGVSKC